MSKLNFLDACLNGEAFIEEIEDYVEKWHDGEGENQELYEFLGFTKDEYTLFLHNNNSVIKKILFNRRYGYSPDQSSMIAARSSSKEESSKVYDWLKSTGRI